MEEDVALARARWRSDIAPAEGSRPSSWAAGPPSPFLLVKPFGLAKLDRIREMVGRDRIAAELPISRYAQLANALFPQVLEVERLVWTVLAQRLLPPEEADAAHMLILRAIVPEELGRLKRRIRRKLGIRFFRVVLGPDCRETSVTPVHAPGPKDLAGEWSTLVAHTAGGQPNREIV